MMKHFLFVPLLHCALADIYMQTPPGCNNRLDEQNRERDNANRLCDTQNNNRGGYNVGKMEYMAGEKVPIAWSHQHGSSKYQMEHSDVIIQYMAEPLVRDGTTTRTIPIKATECQQYDCDTDVRFGRHESLDYYEMCTQTERNKGLFTANQNLKGNRAKYTRQNPQGTRHGYECPEERDHYPYWRPSPWIDVAYITADTTRCALVQAESQNVKERYECRMPDAFFDAGGTLGGNDLYPLDQTACEAMKKTTDAGTDDEVEHTAEWLTIPPNGGAEMACVQVEQTRANHHGNPGGRNLYEYLWDIPDTICDGCQVALRIRYNITTAEWQNMGAWESDASLNAGVNATYNADKNNPNPNNDRSEYPLWADYGLNEADGADDREYEFINNPQVDAFGEEFANGRIKLQLAVNTAQFGRTFQDRSHMYFIKDKPADGECADKVIKLQTVRGKRGNIVQTYPATEYIFHPEKSYHRLGDCVHFAWTGSNTNPNNNDGQGKQGTDRSNMVTLRLDQYGKALYSNFTRMMDMVDGEPDIGSQGNAYPSYIKNPTGYLIPDIFQDELITEAFGGMDETTLVELATTRRAPHDYGNMEELDGAGTGANFEPKEVKKKGCWNYMCTRNNNFSNRAQKGKFCVEEGDVGGFLVGSGGYEYWDSLKRNSVQIWPGSVGGMEFAHINVITGAKTDLVEVTDITLLEDGMMTVQVSFSSEALHKSSLVWQAEDLGDGRWDSGWYKIDFSSAKVDGGQVAIADYGHTGTFKVVNEPNVGPIAALTIAVLCFVVALGWVIATKLGYCKRKGSSNDTTGLNTTLQNEGEGADTL